MNERFKEDIDTGTFTLRHPVYASNSWTIQVVGEKESSRHYGVYPGPIPFGQPYFFLTEDQFHEMFSLAEEQ